VVTARSADLAGAEKKAAEGVGIVSTPDNRWGRCDIKSVGLLPNVLAKQAAREAGAHEAWFVDNEGRVTEGASSTAWIVTADGVLTTRHLDQRILPGITRSTVRAALDAEGVPFEERAFTLDEARAAKEAFITSATSFVTPVVSLDGAPIGEGRPGPVARRLRALYEAAARADGGA
jgi:D-alanine transaminase